jgi:hypothetical protein
MKTTYSKRRAMVLRPWYETDYGNCGDVSTSSKYSLCKYSVFVSCK